MEEMCLCHSLWIKYHALVVQEWLGGVVRVRASPCSAGPGCSAAGGGRSDHGRWSCLRWWCNAAGVWPSKTRASNYASLLFLRSERDDTCTEHSASCPKPRYSNKGSNSILLHSHSTLYNKGRVCLLAHENAKTAENLILAKTRNGTNEANYKPWGLFIEITAGKCVQQSLKWTITSDFLHFFKHFPFKLIEKLPKMT